MVCYSLVSQAKGGMNFEKQPIKQEFTFIIDVPARSSSAVRFQLPPLLRTAACFQKMACCQGHLGQRFRRSEKFQILFRFYLFLAGHKKHYRIQSYFHYHITDRFSVRSDFAE